MKNSLIQLLAQHLFLQEMDIELIEHLLGCAANLRFNADSMIFRQGMEADKLYLIRSGQVALEIHCPQRGSLMIQTMGEGDILGWSWLIPPYHWHFDAHVLQTTRLFALDAQCLRKKCEQNHEFGYLLLKKFAHIMSQRLDATLLQLLDVYGSTPIKSL